MLLLRFITHPDIVMLLTLAVAAVTLGTARGRPLATVMPTYGAALADVGPGPAASPAASATAR